MVYNLGMTNKVCLGGRGVKFSPSRNKEKSLNNTKTKKNKTIRNIKNKGFENKENTVIRKQQRKVYDIGKHKESKVVYRQ